MNINIRLTNKSIESAKKRLQKAQAKIPKMLNEFLKNASGWFIDRANENLENSPIGQNAINNIKAHWRVNIKNNFVSIVNDADEAVFVEFGVGVVGEKGKHPNASKEGYEYNVSSKAKDDTGGWSFLTSEEDIDLPMDKVEISYGVLSENDSSFMVYTHGAQGSMYAFNALIDLKSIMPAIWQQVKEKYWR